MTDSIAIGFKVHGVSVGAANVRTDVDGETLTAQVPCLEVELTTVAERSGSLTLRFVGGAIESAREMFTQDKVLTATFAATK